MTEEEKPANDKKIAGTNVDAKSISDWSIPAGSVAAAAAAGTFHIDSTTGSTWVSGGGSTWTRITGTGEPAVEKKRDVKPVDLPKRMTGRVVIGFIDERDAVEWSAIMPLVDCNIKFDGVTGSIELLARLEDVSESGES